MSKIFFLALIILYLTGCNKQTELQRLCSKIRTAPQTAFPAGTDKRWKLIKELEKIKDEALPDSVQSLFGDIDTSVKGYSEYHYALLNLLAKPDSRKSLKAMAEIFKENYITDPSCSQVLTNFYLTDKRVMIGMVVSYFSKEDRVDYSIVLRNADVMFPLLTTILGKRPFSDRPILDLMKAGIKAGALNKKNLADSQNELIRYYSYLKFARDTLTRQQTKNYIYDGYYESHLPDLLVVLKIFDRNKEIDQIFSETGQNLKTQ